MIRILIVDDHDLVREGVRALLERDPSFEVVGETGDGHEAIKLAGRLEPDVVLMDISLPGGIGGLEAAEAVLAECPRTHVVMLTQYENKEYVRRAIRIGVHGYLLKSSLSGQLREAILAVSRGQRYLHPTVAGELAALLQSGEGLESEDDYERLSKREKQVLTLLADGKTSREIAKYLNISIKTAMTHRAHVMDKLNLHSRAALIKYAFRKKIIPLEGE
ncbi:MAG: response regulator transcription factor [Acidobacteriota bacterium]|nr:response regulator transcription factor [Acidobacteriota bacterium]MDH3784331.1 response regulator transcription factor [Acidobacteriota bacterium]